MIRAWLPVLSGVLVVLASPPARADGDSPHPLLVPCVEVERVGGESLVDDPRLGGPDLVPGWTWRFATDRVGEGGSPGCNVAFEGPSGVRSIALPFSSRVPFEPGRCLFRTRSFCAVDAPPGEGVVPDPAAPAIETFGRRLLQADDRLVGGFEGRRTNAYRWGLVLLALFLAVATAVVLGRSARAAPPPWFAGVGLGVLTLLAFALRVTVPPWTFLHEWHHVQDGLSALYGDISTLYGETVAALFHAGDVLSGGREQAAFATNAVLASLTVPAVALLDFGLFRRWDRALFAGFLMCLLPQHLRFSGSEVLPVATTLFVAWALALLAAYLHRPDTLTALAAAAAIALAMQSRPEAQVLPALALGLVLACGKAATARFFRDRRTWLVLALVAASWGLQRWIRLDASYPDLSFHAVTLQGHTWLRADVTPPLLWFLWTLGAAWAVAHGPGRALWLMVSAEVLTLIPLLGFTNPVYDERTQLPALPFHVILAAGVLVLVRDRLQGRVLAARVAAVLAVALPVVVLATQWDYVTRTTAEQEEWEFLRDTVPTLPDGVGHELVADLDSGRGFPRDLLWRSGKLFNLVELGDVAGAPPPAVAPRHWLVFLGIRCFGSGPAPDFACDAFRDRFELRPVATRVLTGQREDGALSGARHPFEGATYGFYEVTGLRVRSAPEPAAPVVGGLGADGVGEGPQPGEGVQR